MKLRAVNWLPHLQLYQHGCSVTYTVNQHKSILVVQKITTEKHSSAYTCVCLCVISGLWGYGSRFLSLSIVINSMSWWWLVVISFRKNKHYIHLVLPLCIVYTKRSFRPSKYKTHNDNRPPKKGKKRWSIHSILLLWVCTHSCEQA